MAGPTDKQFWVLLVSMLVVGGGSGTAGSWITSQTTGHGVEDAVAEMRTTTAVLANKVDVLGGELGRLANALERGTSDRFTGAQGATMAQRIDDLQKQVTDLRVEWARAQK